ncbi:serine/threonine-protein kinase [Cryptosporangium sp. NPDC048952]|uniref:serine/threonine-protein kinase n=1 Tax=Cryptosporangium sp. NPDC048952 TaxID=3363961 RepID=UPI003713AF90
MIVDRARIEEALPGYVLGEELGRGAFGLVLAARHRQLARDVAIKVLGRPGDSVEEGRFRAEARVLSELDHPHVVRLHDYVEHSGLFLLVMERLSGGSLGERGLERVSPEYACALGLAVADALDAAHGRRVLHRDVKPDNLLFAGDGAVKVTDFGIAKLVEETSAASSSFVGSPVYMAPEQAALGRLGPGTDLYSLSVVLYQLLTGRPLFAVDLPPPAMLLAHLSQEPPPMPDVAARVAGVVLRGLAKDIDDRQPTARSYALDLASAAAASFGGDWLARAGLPVRVDEEVRDAARATSPIRSFDTTVGRKLPDWPWGLPPARLDEVLPDPAASESAAAKSGSAAEKLSLTSTAGRRSGALVVTATPDWLLRPPEPRINPALRGRAVAIGAALLGAVLVAVVVGFGVSTLSTGPHVVPGPGGVVAFGSALYVSDPAHSQVRRFDSAAVRGSGGTVVAGSGRDGYSGDGDRAVDAELSEPGPLAVDGNGNLYIADVGNRRIRKVTADGRISTVVGGGTHALNTRFRADQVRLSEPFSIAVSPQGVLWVSEQQRNRVCRVKPDGRVEAYVGTGQPGFDGDGLYGSWALLNAPTAVAVDPSGDRLYVADQGNRRIREVRVGSGFIRTYAGDGSSGPFRNNVQATTVGLPSVYTLAVTADGSVYLGGSDARRIDPQGFVRPVATLRTISIAATGNGTVYLVAEQENSSGDRVRSLYRRTPAGGLSRLPW